MAAPIPEEEWTLLSNAVAEPTPGMIAVECLDSGQMAEVERRLLALAGARPVLRQIARPGEEAPDATWRRASQLTGATEQPDKLPLLLLELDAVPDAAARQANADYWRGMNQLREKWHDLPAQLVMLLSPAAYEHLSLNADHLKRWIGLKVRLWADATNLVVMERPGRAHPMDPGDSGSNASLAQDAISRRERLQILGKQYEDMARSQIGVLQQLRDQERARQYLIPLIEGYLSLGDLQQARDWRARLNPEAGLEPKDQEVVSRLDALIEDAEQPAQAFHVFLSHNSRDKPAVRELTSALREQGLLVWLDEDELRPGLNWQALIEAGIRQSASVAVLIGQDGLGPWENEEMQGALLLAVKEGRAVIPVLLPDAPKQPQLPLFLHTRTWVDLRPALDEANLGRLIWGVTGRKPASPVAQASPPARSSDCLSPPALEKQSDRAEQAGSARDTPLGAACAEGITPALQIAANPYDPWTPATPPRFFGREKLLRRLGDALDQGRSVSLVGDARIGKSSLLQTWADIARARGREVVLLNGEGAEAESCGSFVKAITDRTLAGDHPDKTADALADWAAGFPLPPLILVDEAERLLIHLPHRFFERLRGLLGRVCLVFASRREIADLAREDHLTSPLANRLELQRLGLLEESAVTQLIGLGAGGFASELAEVMRSWAGRHPFYLTLLGHYLWDARQHGDDLLEALAESEENAGERLTEAWAVLSERERETLVRAAAGHPQTHPGLERRGLLDDGRPFGEVLGDWLRRRAG